MAERRRQRRIKPGLGRQTVTGLAGQLGPCRRRFGTEAAVFQELACNRHGYTQALAILRLLAAGRYEARNALQFDFLHGQCISQGLFALHDLLDAVAFDQEELAARFQT